MKAITVSEFASLVAIAGPCISIYLPLGIERRDKTQDQLRLEKAICEAAAQLMQAGHPATAVDELTDRVRSMELEQAWRNRHCPVAAFLAGANFQRCIPLEYEVPMEIWGDRYLHLRPLLPLVVDSDKFWLLAVSENCIRFFEGDSEVISELFTEELAQIVDDVFGHEKADWVSGVHGGVTPAHGHRTSVIHGQGGQADRVRERKPLCIDRVAALIDRHLQGRSDPLVLACETSWIPLWREASGYPNTLAQFCEGNPDHESIDGLHRRGWHLARREFQSVVEQRIANDHAGSHTLTGLEKLLPAAAIGRIESLVIRDLSPVYGEYDETDERVELSPDPTFGDQDLVETALRETVLHRGHVYGLPHPTDVQAPGVTAEPYQARLRF